MAIPFGRWLGVHLRVHLSLFLLLAVAATYAQLATGSIARGVGLWLVLCAAILVREIARTVAAAYAGTPVRALLLLPFGAVMALEPRAGGLSKGNQRLIAFTGAGANLGVALLLLGFSYGVEPEVNLLRQPWISVEHVLRSAVWLQAALGLVNLLPAKRWSAQRFFAPSSKKSDSKQTEDAGSSLAPASTLSSATSPSATGSPFLGKRVAFGPWTAVAAALLAVGIFFGLLWPVLLGFTLLFMNYVTRVAAVSAADASTLAVRDVMLTEYLPLPSSGTLRDTLSLTTHTLQDTFPVVRGDQLVGWISRTALATRLQVEGDGYLQGVMSRSLQLAAPEEKLPEALRRAAALGAGEFIPVVEHGAMVGILTPASLERAMAQIRLTQAPAPERRDA